MAEEESFRLLCRQCGQASPPVGASWSCVCGAELHRRDGVWLVDDFEPTGFGAKSREHLASFEEDHFWFAGREKLLLACLDRAGLYPQNAIDLGCGNGRFLAALITRGATVVGVEAYADSLARAHRRVPDAALLQADITRVPLPSACCDLVCALDVLEHVEPESLLIEARRLLRPGGFLLLSVPAFASLWSERDVRAGHRKRYRRAELARELAACGLQIEHHTHFQFLLFPLVWLSRRLDARRDLPLERRPPGFFGQVLAAINLLEIRLWGNFRLPWGSSLIALARLQETPA